MLEKHFLRVKNAYLSFTMKTQKNPTDFTGGKALFSFYNEFQKTDAEKDGPLSPWAVLGNYDLF